MVPGVVGHQQGGVKSLQIVFGSQHRLEAVQDEGGDDVPVGGLGAAQLLGDELDLRGDVFIWTH